MSQQSLLLKASGLYSFPSHLSAVPTGALLRANNVVINRDNIVESRRGFKLYGNEMDFPNIANQLLLYKGRIIRQWDSTLEWDNGTGTFSPFSTTLNGNTHSSDVIDTLSSTANLFVGMGVSGSGILPHTTILSITNSTSIVISTVAATSLSSTPIVFTYNISEVDNGLRIKSVEQNGNLYFTTSAGVKKISVFSASDLSSSVIVNAGGIKALDFTATFNASPTFFTAKSVVAYRVVWGINDANKNLILGTPSENEIVRNTTVSDGSVDLNITIPHKVTTSHFYQVYRTAVFPDPTADQNPGDEVELVYENNPTSTDLSNGYVTLTDITPDTFRGASLYTNQNSGEGIDQSNDIPPLCKDIATFKGYTFFANTSTLQRLNLELLSVSNFVANTSTITITDGTTSNTYTFSDSEDIAAKKVLISSASTPGQQVSETALSLIRVINGQDSEIVNAFYTSSPSSVPGLILLEATSLGQSKFSVHVDDAPTTGVEFNPNLSVAATPTTMTKDVSDNETSPNRIYYSKFQQPEAVPALNFIDVGPKDKQIFRILALRDNLFILKEEGVYRLSGLTTPFQVYPLDFSTNIKATDSAVVLNNLIYVFTNQGVATVTDTGVAIISRPIEDQIIKFLTPQYTNFTTSTFGVAYESDRAYYLFTITSASDEVATQCFRFNTFTNSWTLLNLSKNCGIVNTEDDLLYLGATDTNFIEQERKMFDRTDYADREITLSLASGSVNATSITLPSLVNISVGDVLVQVQRVTISQFNRLLTKLDRETSFANHNYTASLSLSAGANVSAAMDALILKIANDAGRIAVAGSTASATYTALSPTPLTFTGQQTTYNALITLLNADAGVVSANYISSVGTVSIELPILSLNAAINAINTNYTYPLVEGDVVVYNHISTDMQFVPQFLSDVSVTKQASEGTFIFEDDNFTSATVSYATDISANFEDIVISGTGNGTFGNTVFGEGLFGGNGSGVPFRTFIPREKQRCRYINCRFRHAIAREIFSLYGISLSFQPISQRGWR